jgi:hypothetical protein
MGRRSTKLILGKRPIRGGLTPTQTKSPTKPQRINLLRFPSLDLLSLTHFPPHSGIAARVDLREEKKRKETWTCRPVKKNFFIRKDVSNMGSSRWLKKKGRKRARQ